MTMVSVFHKACGKIAFYYDDPWDDKPISADRAEYPDGTKPKNGTAMHCGSCGALVGPAELRPGWSPQ